MLVKKFCCLFYGLSEVILQFKASISLCIKWDYYHLPPPGLLGDSNKKTMDMKKSDNAESTQMLVILDYS